MALYKRKDIPILLQEINKGITSQVYLVFGDRYLCRNTAAEIADKLIPDTALRKTQLQMVDGDQEDQVRTLNLLRTFSLFQGRKILQVSDTKLFLSKNVAGSLLNKAYKAYISKEVKQSARFLKQFLDAAGMTSDELINEDIASYSPSRWKTAFGFNKPKEDLKWINDIENAEFTSEHKADDSTKTDVSDHFIAAFEKGIPDNNILILLAETVDKRKRLFKYIQKNETLVDLSVDTGVSSAARKDQDALLKELVIKTLKKYGKKLTSEALPIFLERVGFNPDAAVMETEKLALYTGDSDTVSLDDLNAITGRTREEALFELTEAFTAKKLETALVILSRLQDKGTHALAILATLRNHIRKMLLVRSFQGLAEPRYKTGMSFPIFQKAYLPEIKEGREQWNTLLWKGHPYALYMQFKQAEKFNCEDLQDGLAKILAAEFRVKGSGVPDSVILEDLLFRLIIGPVKTNNLQMPEREQTLRNA